MKYHYSDWDIKKAFERFSLLNNNAEYRNDYKIILRIEKGMDKIKKQLFSSTSKPKAEIYNYYGDLAKRRIDYLKKWNIKILVNPHWKLKLKDLLKSKEFQPGDTKSKFLYALLGGPLENFVKQKLKKGERVSNITAAKDERMKRILCWALIKRTKVRIRALARILGVNNKTITNWYDHIEGLSQQEQNLMLNEIFTGKNMTIKKDALDTHPLPLEENRKFSPQ